MFPISVSVGLSAYMVHRGHTYFQFMPFLKHELCHPALNLQTDAVTNHGIVFQ